MIQYDKPNCECLRCGNKWFSWRRAIGERPKQCPACHSILWDKKRKNKRNKR